MTQPPSAVIDALMAPVTKVTRRVEFYEADGETPWGDTEETSSALKDGSISVDSTRDERRSIDMTLDNSSGVFTRDPNNGFWYDKVVKVYRGVEYQGLEAYEDLIKSQEPAVYWRMDDAGIVRDRSGRGMHARRVGWPFLANPLVNTPDSTGSIRFSEAQTFLRSSDIDSLHPAYSASVWTMEAWVRPIGLNPAFGGQVFGRDGIDCRLQVATDMKLQALVRNAGGTLFVASPGWVATPGRIYHMAATLDGASLKLYVDGKLEATVAFSGASIVSTTGFSTGNAGDGTTKQLKGDVDECVFYDRVLSRNEIAHHFQAGRGTRQVTHGWEAQVGEFLIDKIDESRFPKDTKITGRDYTKKCLLAKLPVAMRFDTTTPLEDFVRAMAANAGIKKFKLPKTGVTIGSATDFDQGTERWNVMHKACETATYDLYFTPDGYLTMRKQQDPSTSPVTLVFQTGPKGNLVDWSKSSTDTEIRNRIICISESSDDVLPFYGEASNTEETSPTNIARLGERTEIYTSPFFTSNEQCVATAQAMLKVKALESFNVDFSSLVFPWTEAGEIVEFLDPDAAAYDPTRFLLSSFTIPLKLGPMTATAKRIIIVGDIVQSISALVAEGA